MFHWLTTVSISVESDLLLPQHGAAASTAKAAHCSGL
jgi:hypothetical protein